MDPLRQIHLESIKETLRLMALVLEARALTVLKENPMLLMALYNIRVRGRLDVDEEAANTMVYLGLLNIDENGCYLSDVAEDALGIYERVMKEHTPD